MPRLGFLHTAAVHVPTFDRLVAANAPDTETTHIVDGGLLALAEREGLTPRVVRGISERVVELRDAGADAIVCTCSTLGPAADAVGRGSTVPVVRIDRPMAERATRIGERIAVVAALRATVTPTVDLLEACADEPPTVVTELCTDAWEAFLAGDVDDYLAQVAQVARRAARNADVVVLAQASMAPVLESLADIRVPVLASPEPAVLAALRCCAADDVPPSPAVG